MTYLQGQPHELPQYEPENQSVSTMDIMLQSNAPDHST